MKKLTSTSLLLILLVSLTQSHYFWAEINVVNKNTVEVTLTFSDKAGLPSTMIQNVSHQIPYMNVLNEKDDEYLIAMKSGKEGDRLVGTLADSFKPVIASGFVDYGPFEEIMNLRYTFSAQLYSQESDWESFFQGISSKRFLVLMKSCGPPYQFRVTGVDAENTHVDICLYHKGGLLIDCTSNLVGNQFSIEAERELRNSRILYALANTTVMIDDEETVLFATTSVALDGPCKE